MITASAAGSILLAAAQLTLFVADGMPTLNVQPSCRAAAQGSIGLAQDLNACLQTEERARVDAERQWGTFAPADRTNCVGLTTSAGGGTYTELLTCLEMSRDARRLPKEGLPEKRDGTVGVGRPR
jgi:hypothetical protein